MTWRNFQFFSNGLLSLCCNDLWLLLLFSSAHINRIVRPFDWKAKNKNNIANEMGLGCIECVFLCTWLNFYSVYSKLPILSLLSFLVAFFLNESNRQSIDRSIFFSWNALNQQEWKIHMYNSKIITIAIYMNESNVIANRRFYVCAPLTANYTKHSASAFKSIIFL